MHIIHKFSQAHIRTISKYWSADIFFKNASINFVGSFLANVLSYVFNLILGRMLGPELYGEYVALLSIWYLALIPASALNTVTAKETAKYVAVGSKDTLILVLKLILKYSFLAGAIIFVLISLSSTYLADVFKTENSLSIVLMALTICLSYLSGIFLSALQGMEKFALINIWNAVALVMRIIFVVVFISIGLQVSGIFLGMVLSLGVMILLLYVQVQQQIHNLSRGELLGKLSSLHTKLKGFFQRQIADQEILKGILGTARSTLLATTSTVAMVQVDIMLAKIYLDTYSAGIYSALAVSGKVIPFFSMPLAAALFPRLAHKHTLKQPVHKLIMLVAAIIGTVCFFSIVAYLVFPNLIVGMFFGESYMDAVQYLGLFAIFQALYTMLWLFSMIFIALEQHLLASSYVLINIFQVLGILVFHQSILQLIYVSIAVTSCALLFYGVKMFLICRPREKIQ
jgi:O-antigen/teichoic acid export membrane protein